MKTIVPTLLFALFVSSACLAQPLVIDGFDYQDDAAAQAAWQEMAGAPPVEMEEAGAWGDERVMQLPCGFSQQVDRAYWDRSLAVDLSGHRALALEVFVPDPGAVSHFTLYFRSGSGWYGQGMPVDRPGWQTWVFPIDDFSTEDSPAGWNQVDTIRLSPWKGADQDTYLALRELRAYTPHILIVRDTQTADSRTVDNTIDTLAGWLGRYNLSFAVVDDTTVESGYLEGSRMAILPFNDAMSDPLLTALESYVGGGGKLMAFYLLDARVAALLGIEQTGWTQGDFAAYRFQDTVIGDLPPRVEQDSWNITIAAPTAQHNARIIAEWDDSQGVATGEPAWLASDNGLFMSHILLSDDAVTKQYMLLVLIGHYVPAIWPGAAAAAIEHIGAIADYLGYDQAAADIRARGATTPRAQQVDDALALADAGREQAVGELEAGRYPQAVLTAGQARTHLIEAYTLCQSPVWPEFRAVWEHSGTGPYPGNWAAAIDALSQNNFTAVFPNMLWGGLAHYDSGLLPVSEVFQTHGDQIRACVEAAHARGIEVHVWKVNWNLSTAPQWFVDEMRAAGRTQVTVDGEQVDWLCPSHPDNFQLELDSMLEVVEGYDVDGIHFDYIRYPNSDHCYCDGCRARFEQQTGHQVGTWPDDVTAGGPLESAFLDWRRAQITNLVRAVYQQAKSVKPGVQVSAAVFSSQAYAYDGVGQDWAGWIDEGIVDFLCPMDYTNDFDRFGLLVDEQLDFAAGRVPIIPGIGVSSSSSSFGPDGTIVQILATRARDTGGFILFNYDRQMAENILPALGRGTTADTGADGGTDAGHDAGTDDAGSDDAGSDDAGHDAGQADQGTDAGTDVADEGRDAGSGTDQTSGIEGGCGCAANAPGGLGHMLLALVSIVIARRRSPAGYQPSR